jgi:hypothetical protein
MGLDAFEKLLRGAQLGLEVEVLEVVVVAVIEVVEVVVEEVIALEGTEEAGKAALILAAMPKDADVRTFCNLGPRASEDADGLDETLLSPSKAEDEEVVKFIAERRS